VTNARRPRPGRLDKDAPLVVWGERRPDPDWDRFLAALIALALRRVEEEADKPTKEARD
jgi:hypothetical protein